MVPSIPHEGLLQLGKRLVEELDLGDSVDTLSRWLTHVLARKLQAATTADDSMRPALEAEAIDLILTLWSRRRDYPSGKRPFEDLEDLDRVLQQIDPQNTESRYFNPALLGGLDAAPTPAKTWLQRALSIDNAARTAITYCLLAADEATPGKRREWAELAEAAGLHEDIEIRIVRFIGRLRDDCGREALDDPANRSLQLKQEKIGLLKDAASEIQADIAQKLRAQTCEQKME